MIRQEFGLDFSTFLNFFQTHQEVLKKLVDLIGITSIMEVSLLYHLLGSEIP